MTDEEFLKVYRHVDTVAPICWNSAEVREGGRAADWPFSRRGLADGPSVVPCRGGRAMTTCTFKQAKQMARDLTGGAIPRARLWNALVTRYKAGKDIGDFATMALVASVVGDREAPLFVATIKDIYGRKVEGAP